MVTLKYTPEDFPNGTVPPPPVNTPTESIPQLQSGASGVQLLPDPIFLWQVFCRNFLLFFTVAATIIALTAAFLSVQVPTYAARSSILIEPTTGPVRTSAPGVRGFGATDEIDTELRIIMSPLVTKTAAQLYADRNTSPNGDPFTAEEIDNLADLFGGSIYASRSGQTRVVDINAKGTDPEMVAKIANIMAEAYLKSQVDSKTTENVASSDFINTRLRELERNAQAAQGALDNYRASAGLIGGNGINNASLEVSTLTQQLASAQADLAEKQARYDTARSQLSSGGGGDNLGATLGSGTIGSLRQQEARVSADLAVIRERYGDLHPQRRQTEEQLKDVRSRIQDEINRILSSLRSEVQTARARATSLKMFGLLRGFG